MFPLYYMYIDLIIMFKSSRTHWCIGNFTSFLNALENLDLALGHMTCYFSSSVDLRFKSHVYASVVVKYVSIVSGIELYL